MKLISEFVSRFGVGLSLSRNLIVERKNRFFLLTENLKKLLAKDFFYAGIYLGKAKGSRFFPSFNLLKMIAKNNANKVIVDDKTAWLFICGRDIFRQGIVEGLGSKKKGDYTLVLNQHGECLGFGRILRASGSEKNAVVAKNISDIGDFLRREKQQKHVAI